MRRNGKEQIIGGKRWIGDRVTKIVANPIYRGAIVHQDQEFQGVHEALVTESLWTKANKALSSINTPAPPHAKHNKHELLLKGFLRCHQCGNLMTPKPSGKKDSDGNPYLYYCCGDVNRDGLASSCGFSNIGSKPFEEFVIKVIGEMGRHPDVIKATLAASKIRGNKAIRPLQKKIAAAEKSKRSICDQIQSYVEMVKKLGADNVGDKFVVEMKALGDQNQKAEVEIETLKMDLQRLEKLVITEAHVSDALLQFKKVFDTLDFAEQRELIELLI